MWPIYLGGFIGPFGGAMTNTMLPELAQGLSTDLHTAATSVTWYVLPFALVMLFSGTIATRVGRTRAVRTAYIVYALASLIGVIATTPALFMAGRALQGTANAFTSPILVALLASMVPSDRFGRTLGLYASFQAAGQAFAPLVGGFAAGIDYRWAFVATSAVAVMLALVTPSAREEKSSDRPRWRALANSALVRASTVAFSSQLAVSALIMLAAIIATDRFGLDPTMRGLVVASFGVAGFASGGLSGRLVDKIGLRPTGMTALLVLGLATAALGVVPWLAGLIVCLVLGGGAATAVRILTNTMAVHSTRGNTSGATSIMMAFQFLGSAISPLFLTAYTFWSPAVALLLGGIAAIFALAVAALPSRRP